MEATQTKKNFDIEVCQIRSHDRRLLVEDADDWFEFRCNKESFVTRETALHHHCTETFQILGGNAQSHSLYIYIFIHHGKTEDIALINDFQIG
jgi:hypothetical protein